MLKTLLIIFTFVPTITFAHGNKIDLVSNSVQKVLQTVKSQNDEVSESFTGTKSWLSGSQIMVKVYYKPSNETLNIVYRCEMEHSDGGEQLICELR